MQEQDFVFRQAQTYTTSFPVCAWVFLPAGDGGWEPPDEGITADNNNKIKTAAVDLVWFLMAYPLTPVLVHEVSIQPGRATISTRQVGYMATLGLCDSSTTPPLVDNRGERELAGWRLAG
jgi:hypothetical protein